MLEECEEVDKLGKIEWPEGVEYFGKSSG